MQNMNDLERSSEETYEYMNKPTMKWNESTKPSDTRKTILTSFFFEMETEIKKWTKMLFF